MSKPPDGTGAQSAAPMRMAGGNGAEKLVNLGSHCVEQCVVRTL
jgi:hypothetical protein